MKIKFMIDLSILICNKLEVMIENMTMKEMKNKVN